MGQHDDPEKAFTEFFTGPYRDVVQDLDEQYPDERSLRIDWHELDAWDGSVADEFLQKPARMRQFATNALNRLEEASVLGANVRIYNLPEKQIVRVGKYRTRQLGKLLSVRGKVVDMEGVTPYAEEAAFECPLCGTLTRMPQSYGDLMKPNECMGCEHSKPGFRFKREQSELVDLQKIVIIPPDSNLEEPPGSIAFLKNDLVDMVGPGDLVTINGIYETFTGQSESTLSTYIEALDLDIKERTEIDTYGASEIQEFVMDALTEQITTVDDFAVQRSDIVDAVTSEHGVRREEVEDQIDALIEANEIGAEGSKLFDL
ncbi:minichromosome maintenance protein MCM [Halopiger xanaduensis]|uniref:ATPase involved in replication control Cdc46/Mcm family-like protein n=1 Tax=Halopiger xanaduensis (strain DSM 18323 / JCM 14033 / SH-6) TaxID=797210 RepID=F8DET6_HALXS|nr:minichromosome maintenance protein MCM [Halopiger xanaduensis]AEH39526.1 ATPase involved in replication control Cdc46/Mcm family-like protein [Halopiger xanaduensis SH-6]